MTSWRDGLVPASFKGVSFSIQGHEGAFGRRVQLHEYPLRDTPFAEDLGRRARTLSVDALVLGGDNYWPARNALLDACESAGPGTLKHPYLGELRVVCTGCKLREDNQAGGVARFTLDFVELGEAKFPSGEASTAAAVVAKADYAAEAVQAQFERRMSVAGKPAFVAAGAGTIFSGALASIQGAVGKVRGAADAVAQLQRDVDAARNDLTTLIYAPASAAQALVASIKQLVRSVATAPADALSLARTLYRFGALLPDVQPSTTSRKQQALNQAELLGLVRVTAAAEGARAVAAVTFDNYQAAVAARDELVDTLDDAMLSAGVSDELYDALRGLRAAVVRDVAARGADLARLVTWQPAVTTPSLALAQQLWADGAREPELTARNAIRHPLFVAGAVPLEVLADA